MLTVTLDRGPKEPSRSNRKKPKLKATTREYVRRSGTKRFSFNPNYYPTFQGRDPLTKFMPVGMVNFLLYIRLSSTKYSFKIMCLSKLFFRLTCKKF